MEQVCVIGVGFVGEHLVEIFSKKYKVIGYDVSPKRVTELKEKFVANSNVTFQSSKENLELSNLFCLSVPTLLLDANLVDDRNVRAAIKIVDKVAREGAAVVMESSVAVGMTRALLGSFRQKKIYVGFSPERADPGRLDPPVDKIHKVLAGADDESLAVIKRFYASVFDHIVPVSSLELAEMSKLTENCFRMINIAFVNEIADACHKWNIDAHELINACATKPFGYMPFFPGLGVGGHCIPVNPGWLAINNDIPLVKHAAELTKHRPVREAQRLIHQGHKNVLVVGIAFKPGQRLTTNSPAVAYAAELQRCGIKVAVYDPLVDADDANIKAFHRLKTADWNASQIDNFDAVCIAMKQTDIDYTILKDCKKAKIVKYCD